MPCQNINICILPTALLRQLFQESRPGWFRARRKFDGVDPGTPVPPFHLPQIGRRQLGSIGIGQKEHDVWCEPQGQLQRPQMVGSAFRIDALNLLSSPRLLIFMRHNSCGEPDSTCISRGRWL